MGDGLKRAVAAAMATRGPKRPKATRSAPPMDQPKVGDLRVWHIPQVPGKAYRVNVASVDEGRKVLRLLAEYDLFQYEHRIKPDYASAQGLEVLEEGSEEDGGGWCEWSDEEGNDYRGR